VKSIFINGLEVKDAENIVSVDVFENRSICVEYQDGQMFTWASNGKKRRTKGQARGIRSSIKFRETAKA
jgi:hypothetical protein